MSQTSRNNAKLYRPETAPSPHRGLLHIMNKGGLIVLQMAGATVRIRHAGRKGAATRLHISAPQWVKFSFPTEADGEGPAPAA